MIAENLLTLMVLLPFLGAIVAATMPGDARNALTGVSAVVMVAMLGILFGLRDFIGDGAVVSTTIRWVDSLGLNLRFRIDGFAWLMMMLVAGIGLLVVVYARWYMSEDDAASRFHAAILTFTGAMTGVLLSGNIIMLVVFWELTSLASFVLISYWHQKPEARRGARVALTVTAAGGLCLLVSMAMIGHIAGSFELDIVLARGAVIRAHPLYEPILFLFLLAAFTKSAQFPFHFWLPNAMAAPTPVSTFLHSATMVKAGVFLLVRFFPVLGGTDMWFFLVTGIGMITLTMGAVTALFRHDLKGLLAYSTISHLGLITALAGIGSPAAIIAAIFHIVNHAVFKASLFMSAGIIDHETGTRDMRRLSGLRRWLPITSTLAIVAAASMAGVPLLNGFLSKEMFFDVAQHWNNGSMLDNALPWIAVFASAFSVAYSLRFILKVFFGPPATALPVMPPHEPPVAMRRPVELLVFLCLGIGLFPALLLGAALQDAGQSVLGAAMPAFSLKLWHGWNLPLMMSIVAFAAGVAIYLLTRRRLNRSTPGTPERHYIDGLALFDRLQRALTAQAAPALHRLMTAASLQTQLRAVVLVTLALTALVLPGTEWVPAVPAFGTSEAVFALLWLIGAVCAIGTAWQAKYHRFAALVMLGGVGLMTVITFAWLSAPDLAVTQLVVEITTTILLLLGLRWLPQRSSAIPGDRDLSAHIRRGRDLAIAVAGGLGVTAVAYAVFASRAVPGVGDWFLRNAYSEGGGTNVVNVILVDFRAFDTFGEIVVLGTVGLTIFALLRRFRPAPESAELPRARTGDGLPAEKLIAVPALMMRWMFPVTILLAAYFFLRGHDLPGGGFAAGVTLAIGLTLQYIASDVRWIEDRLLVLPVLWIAFGLSMAVLVGLGSWLFGYPFLTAHAQYITLPVVGQVPAATAMLFDLGVFAVVVGSTTLIVIAIAHQTLRVSAAKPRRKPEPEPTATEATTDTTPDGAAT
ncbi:MAG: monovalent cation/H+ antiporter subunit A [Paracoccus sp. (in: a-proteobacteria)]|uniref:monovalent cation/H+ antiporter subunit A n=1 Tax=Paracoccus sp. TaxID=267 RepID=UPI0026DF8881|nr:monovalent cation/H+ antiporter subunit A [Paracoccus sp. (in: a-proteobacteria)]MDO5620298.1 monovalent cation/H+ antiporter subunit A [Paracoccus sp. (in: a-proteobacteria)]